MRTLLLLAALIGASLAGDWEVEDGVLVLNNENFQSAVDEHNFLLVEFCECRNSSAVRSPLCCNTSRASRAV